MNWKALTMMQPKLKTTTYSNACIVCGHVLGGRRLISVSYSLSDILGDALHDEEMGGGKGMRVRAQPLCWG